jgi:hypothetical protein
MFFYFCSSKLIIKGFVRIFSFPFLLFLNELNQDNEVINIKIPFKISTPPRSELFRKERISLNGSDRI